MGRPSARAVRPRASSSWSSRARRRTAAPSPACSSRCHPDAQVGQPVRR